MRWLDISLGADEIAQAIYYFENVELSTISWLSQVPSLHFFHASYKRDKTQE